MKISFTLAAILAATAHCAPLTHSQVSLTQIDADAYSGEGAHFTSDAPYDPLAMG